MQCETAQEVLVAVLYEDGAAPEEKKNFYEHLRNCASCRDEFFEIMETRALLQQWPDIQPPSVGELPLPNQESSGFRRWFAGWTLPPAVTPIAWTRVAWLLVLGALALLVAINTEVRIGREGLVLRAGLTPDSAMDQREIVDLVSYMLDESERRQSRAYAQALIRLQETTQAQRQYDVLEMERSQTELEKRYLNGVEDSNRMLKQIAQRVYR